MCSGCKSRVETSACVRSRPAENCLCQSGSEKTKPNRNNERSTYRAARRAGVPAPDTQISTTPLIQPASCDVRNLEPRVVTRFQKENERISTTPFLLWHFSPGDKIENCSAQFLAVSWIVHVELKVHRTRDGVSVRNALLLDQSLPAFVGHNLDQIGDRTLLQRCHLFQFVSLLLTHRQVELPFALVIFRHSHFLDLFFIGDHAG